MRKVYPRQEIAHLWIHQTQDEARTPTGNFYFNGATLYSYGSHYVCGHIMPVSYGRTVLVNDGSWSMTTQRHMAGMRQAIPDYMRKIAVPGLRGAHVDSIRTDGTREVCAVLLREYRDAVQEAATRKNVRAATRAGCLYTAARIGQDLQFLLRVDIARKDLGKAKRDAARAMLRSVPATVPAGVADMTSKEARATCEAFAASIMRDQCRENMQKSLRLFAGNMDTVENFAPDGTAWTTGDALNAAGCAVKNLADAQHAAKLAGAKIPAAVTKRAANLPALRASLMSVQAQQNRERDLRTFRENFATIAAFDNWVYAWRAEQSLRNMESLAISLAMLNTEDETAQQSAMIAEARDIIAAGASRSALDRAPMLVRLAGEAMAAGNLRDVQARRNDLATVQARGADVRGMLAQVDAWIVDATAQRDADAIAAWRAGGSVNGLPYIASRGALLRLSRDGADIETSQGARVPVSVAPMVWQAANACRDTATAHELDPPPRIGHFTLDRIDTAGNINAGCHYITYAELHGIAVALGYVS